MIKNLLSKVTIIFCFCIFVFFLTSTFEIHAADGVIQTDNGIASSVNSGSNFYSVNFVADRSVHYNINGGKYVRKVYASLDKDIFFAPQNHNDFTNLSTKYTFSAYLDREGTNTYDQKKLEYYSSVKIVDLEFYWWFGTQKNETYKATKSMTQERTYYRYYIPPYY